MSCLILFNGFCGCAKDCSSSFFFIFTCCCVIIFCQSTKFFCSIKVLLSKRKVLLYHQISLLYLSFYFKVNNLKLNSIVRFNLIHSFANKLVISLFVTSMIKMTSLKIRFICYFSKSSRTALINTRTV